jgi:hypothetical protein
LATVEQVRILEAVSRLLPTVDALIWQPAQMHALAQAVFDYGPRWTHIVQKQLEDRELGLAGITPDQLLVCPKALFCDIKFQTPQCDIVIHYRYASIEMYRYSGTTFLYFYIEISGSTYLEFSFVSLIWL